MEIKLYNDIVFKWAFGREEHPAPLISLLNSVVGHEGEKPEFTEIRIVNPYDRSEPFTGEKNKLSATIFAVTAYASIFELSECPDAGFDDYFTKPVELKTLLRQRRMLLQKTE